MATAVISGFSPSGYIEYGKAFIRTFDRFWPEQIKLIVYTEEPVDVPPRCQQRCVWDIPGCKLFVDEHHELRYHGKQPVAGWNKKDERFGYSYRFDVVRFCRQLFIPDDAARSLADDDILVWLDADVITYADVPLGLVEKLIGNNDLVTMGRDGSSTELGFWAVRLNSKTRHLLTAIADCYRDRSVFSLYEWHSGYVFDHWVQRIKSDFGLKHASLTSGRGHVWFQCEIGKYTDHLKGSMRKQKGYSPERFGRCSK